MCTALAVLAAPQPGRSPAYHMTFSGKSDGPVVLRVLDEHDKVAWSLRIASFYAKAWSRDHRSLVVVDDRSHAWKHPWYYRFIVWRAGHRPRVLDYIAPDRTEVILLLSWSPDGRRLLIHGAGNQGSGSLHVGKLWCLNADTWAVRRLNDGDAQWAHWIGPRAIRVRTREFWEFDPKHPNVPNYRDRYVTVRCP